MYTNVCLYQDRKCSVCISGLRIDFFRIQRNEIRKRSVQFVSMQSTLLLFIPLLEADCVRVLNLIFVSQQLVKKSIQIKQSEHSRLIF